MILFYHLLMQQQKLQQFHFYRSHLKQAVREQAFSNHSTYTWHPLAVTITFIRSGFSPCFSRQNDFSILMVIPKYCCKTPVTKSISCCFLTKSFLSVHSGALCTIRLSLLSDFSFSSFKKENTTEDKCFLDWSVEVDIRVASFGSVLFANLASIELQIFEFSSNFWESWSIRLFKFSSYVG